VVCNPKPRVVLLAFSTFVDDHFEAVETPIRYTGNDGSDPRIRVPRVILLAFRSLCIGISPVVKSQQLSPSNFLSMTHQIPVFECPVLFSLLFEARPSGSRLLSTICITTSLQDLLTVPPCPVLETSSVILLDFRIPCTGHSVIFDSSRLVQSILQ